MTPTGFTACGILRLEMKSGVCPAYRVPSTYLLTLFGNTGGGPQKSSGRGPGVTASPLLDRNFVYKYISRDIYCLPRQQQQAINMIMATFLVAWQTEKIGRFLFLSRFKR